jgi:hypothetical protein
LSHLEDDFYYYPTLKESIFTKPLLALSYRGQGRRSSRPGRKAGPAGSRAPGELQHTLFLGEIAGVEVLLEFCNIPICDIAYDMQMFSKHETSRADGWRHVFQLHASKPQVCLFGCEFPGVNLHCKPQVAPPPLNPLLLHSPYRSCVPRRRKPSARQTQQSGRRSRRRRPRSASWRSCKRPRRPP